MGNAVLTKQQILDSAFRLAKDGSAEELTIAAICADVGISKSTFYKYFDSKEALFSNLYGAMEPKILEAIPGILLSGASPLLKYWSIWRYYIDQTAAVGPTVLVYVAKTGFSQKTHGFFYINNLAILETQRTLLRQAQEQGEVKNPTEAKALHHLILLFLVGRVVEWSHMKAPYDYVPAVYKGMMQLLVASPAFGPADMIGGKEA